MERFRKRSRLYVVMMLVILVLSGCQTFKNNTEEILKITVLKVGRADAILIEKDRHVMVIDTGEEDDGEKIVEYLRKENIEKIDCLIISHYDKDHVGGADILLTDIEAEEIFLPDYPSNSTEYLDFMRVVKEKGYSLNCLSEDYAFTFCGCSVYIHTPLSYTFDASTDYDNNLSLIVSLTYGSQRFVFMGDAEKSRITEWLSQDPGKYTFIKMPHHGVYNSALRRLLEETAVSYAVICDSKKNPAEEATLKLLDQYRVMTYETKNGNITVLSDGIRIEMHQ